MSKQGFTLPEIIAFLFLSAGNINEALLWIHVGGQLSCQRGNCSLVKRLHAAERCLASFLQVGYRALAAGFSTFHFLSLSLKIKKMDGYIQTLTGKAPYAVPAGSLPHFFKHKDSEIAELEHILFFFRICESDTPTNKQILLPRALCINTETYSPKYF